MIPNIVRNYLIVNTSGWFYLLHLHVGFDNLFFYDTVTILRDILKNYMKMLIHLA
jgi:hypothetical protein